MKTTPITIDTLITDYAVTIADAVGITLDADDCTEAGFIGFLDTAANRLGSLGQTREWLTEAADLLRTVQHLGDDAATTRERLLKQVDRLLYEANEELRLA